VLLYNIIRLIFVSFSENQMLSSVCLDNWVVFTPIAAKEGACNLVQEIVRQGKLLGMAAFSPLNM